MREQAEGLLAEARTAAERELAAAERERTQRLAEVRSEPVKLAERPHEEADEELRVYTERRRREAESARTGRPTRP